MSDRRMEGNWGNPRGIDTSPRWSKIEPIPMQESSSEEDEFAELDRGIPIIPVPEKTPNRPKNHGTKVRIDRIS